MGVPIIQADFNTVDYSKEMLLNYFPKGSTVHLVIRQVSRSGMYRHISVHGIKNNTVYHYSFHVAKVLEWTYKDKTNAVGIGGCGMDMGFHLVYTLASVLYNDGYALTHKYI